MNQILFEPSYELGNNEQKQRMEKHNYVRNIPHHVKSLGGKLVHNELMATYSNKLNRTAAFVINKNPPTKTNKPNYIDPISKVPLEPIDNYSFYFSCKRGVVYPIIKGIPVINDKATVLASALLTEKI